MGSPYRTAKQIREARLVIVAELYKKGYAFSKIREEVMKRENLDTYSKSTVKKDIDILLNEWRSTRIEDIDLTIQLELERIDGQIAELWEAWDKSKTDHKTKLQRQKGELGAAVSGKGEIQEGIRTTHVERTEKEEINFGDARYQAEITKLGQERRKILGLYAPEKKDHTSKGESLSGGFYDFLLTVNTEETEVQQDGE